MNIPTKCPSCEGKLVITELCCAECKTTIRGGFELPAVAALNPEEEGFLCAFLAARGSIKEVERQLGISYPTVRGRLEALLLKLGIGKPQAARQEQRAEIVGRLERGEIAAAEAVKLLRELED